ncbi:hypothetical protein AKJ16_DCAP04561 [Drosera capensis]
MWSRSNSVNSKSSSCSSARTRANDRDQVIENKSGLDKVTLKAFDPFVPRRRRTKSAECVIQGKMSPEKIKDDEGEEKRSNEKSRGLNRTCSRNMRFPHTPKTRELPSQDPWHPPLLRRRRHHSTLTRPPPLQPSISVDRFLRPQFSLSPVDMELSAEDSEEFGDS